MTGESLAIIAVILVLSFMFLRAGKKPVALLSLPLVSVPALFLLSGLVRGLGFTGWGLDINIFMVLVGVVAGSAACALLSLMIRSRRGKTAYLIFSLAFQVAIAVGYVVNLI